MRLRQSGSATLRGASEAMHRSDGWVESTFEPLSGKEDEAAGVVLRWKNGSGPRLANRLGSGHICPGTEGRSLCAPGKAHGPLASRLEAE